MKRILRMLPVIIAAIAIFAASTLSWLIVDNTVPFPTNFGGSTKTAYFAGGDGSNDDPYIIENPVHFYNLAWLQYLGYFNLGSYINNGRAQSFFKLDFDGDNLNLGGLALPPIGTREYPFIGYFNGNGKTISNFTVSNSKTDLIRRPLAAVFSGDVLYTTGTRTSVVAGSVDILGLFGVTGNFSSFLTDYDGKKVPVDGTDTTVEKHEKDSSGSLVELPDATDKIPANDFYYSGMNVRNFYVDKIRINSVSSSVLVGLAAGYVSSTVENVGVYRSKVTVKGDSLSGVSNVKRASGTAVSYDGVISNYSIVGDYDSEIVGWTEAPSSGGTSPGEDTNWGGSIDMEALYNRLLSFRSNASYVNGSTYADATSGSYKRFYDADKGSAYFSNITSSILYLYGGKNEVTYVSDNVPDGGFFIKSGSNYLTLNNIKVNSGVSNTTDSTKAVTWYFDDETKALYTIANGYIMYLNSNPSSTAALMLSFVQTTEWTKNAGTLSYVAKGSTYYLGYSGGWKGVTSSQSISFDSNGKMLASTKYTYSGTINNENRSFATFLPILTNDDYTVSDKNPGYIASGSNVSGGDVRVRYDAFASNKAIYKAINSVTTFENEKTLEVFTRTKKSDGFVLIEDDYNKNNTSIHSELSDYVKTKTSYSDLGLSSYYDKGVDSDGKTVISGARKNLNDLLLNKSGVYGFHFMNAMIGKNNVYTAPKTMINGTICENYEMPANAISFAAPSKGHVSFFAGTYYSKQDKNFFSLHRVFRNADKTISAIKEISKIYSTGGQRYVYEYTDGTFSDTLSGNYELEFDCEWITNPTIVKNALYYFEIPVNAGDEYALGSATTGDGAYLIYLDIGANGSGSGGGGGETQTLPYIMQSVDFVAMPTNDSSDTLIVPTDNGSVKFPKYRDVGFKLGATADVIYFRREDYDSLPADDGEIETIVYYYRENNAILVTVFPTGYGEEDDGTNAKWE